MAHVVLMDTVDNFSKVAAPLDSVGKGGCASVHVVFTKVVMLGSLEVDAVLIHLDGFDEILVLAKALHSPFDVIGFLEHVARQEHLHHIFGWSGIV